MSRVEDIFAWHGIDLSHMSHIKVDLHYMCMLLLCIGHLHLDSGLVHWQNIRYLTESGLYYSSIDCVYAIYGTQFRGW